MKTETYKFHTDPGHGWLQVPRVKLKELKIENEISQYSYVKGDDVFLEEDLDAGLFCQAMKKLNQEFKTEEINSDNESFIRGFQSYRF